MSTPPLPAPVSLHCRDEGAGPAILLLHGLGGDHTIWNGILPELVRRHRVLAPDLRGHGRSQAPPGSTFSFREMESDVAALLDQKQLEGVHLVGLSAGAFLALHLALDLPARVRSLIVIGGATHCDQHTRAVADRWAETFQKEGFDAYLLRLLKDLFYPDWIDAHMEFLDRVREQQKRENARSVIGWGNAMRSFDLRGRLGKVKAPTLIGHGVDDQVVDAAHGRLLRQSIWGSELKLFAQTGHLVPLERPAETVDSIVGWVEKAETRDPKPPAT